MKKKVSKPALLCMVLLCAACAKPSTTTHGDLSQEEGNRIRLAMLSGDISLLPTCAKASCSFGKSELISAIALRIEGKLNASMADAVKCFGQSSIELITHYTCARIINMDAKDEYGLYGDWSTIDRLADAVEPAYRDHLFGITDSYSSSYLQVWRGKLHALKLTPERVRYDASKTTVPLFGQLRSTVFIGKESRVSKTAAYQYPSIAVSVNGVALVLQIDTGSQTTTLTSSAARKVGVDPIDGLYESTLSITGKELVVRAGIARTLNFANVQFTNKSVQIVPDSPGALGVLADGTLGFDAIRKLHAFEFTRRALIVDPGAPSQCNGDLAISSDINTGGVLGLVLRHSTFNNNPVVALLDTGNTMAGAVPTGQLAMRRGVEVKDPHFLSVAGSGGYSRVDSGYVQGALRVLGKEYTGKMEIAANFPGTPIDFDIGMPIFGGQSVYVDLDRMKICVDSEGPRRT